MTDKVTALLEQLEDEESTASGAAHRNDNQLKLYARGRALNIKQRIARLEPNGRGAQFINTLSDAERRELLEEQQ